MRLSYPAVLAWLTTHCTEFTTAQLEQLDGVVQAALEQARARDAQTADVLRRMDELAREAGASSAAEILQRAAAQQGGVEAPAVTQPRKLRTDVRKPYLDPYDANSGIYAAKNLSETEWFKRAQAKGWTMQQCHYKHLADTWKSRGMKPLYDPVERHAQLVQQELAAGVVYSRGRKSK